MFRFLVVDLLPFFGSTATYVWGFAPFFRRPPELSGPSLLRNGLAELDARECFELGLLFIVGVLLGAALDLFCFGASKSLFEMQLPDKVSNVAVERCSQVFVARCSIVYRHLYPVFFRIEEGSGEISCDQLVVVFWRAGWREESNMVFRVEPNSRLASFLY